MEHGVVVFHVRLFQFPFSKEPALWTLSLLFVAVVIPVGAQPDVGRRAVRPVGARLWWLRQFTAVSSGDQLFYMIIFKK